jgi:fructose-bisphosphate aldolase class I
MVEAKKDFKAELIETAKRISRPGFGILAADESTNTIGKKFTAINVENNEENRRKYRELLFTTPDFEKYISGVILFEETAKQSTKDGKPFIKLLQEKGVIPGIKVDKGLQDIPGTNGEQATFGLDDLAKRCQQFYAMGCRFAKWRNTIKIAAGCPTELAIKEVAWALARYAAICQDNGLVPIVEPEVLPDGDHDINRCAEVTQKVQAACFKALHDNHILFEGMLLKPNMVCPGTSSPVKATPVEVARTTVSVLSRTVPPAVPGINFLSGGWSEEEASQYLNEMNKITDIPHPWSLSFSYGRALQNSAVKTWAGKDENFKAGQDAFFKRCVANGTAQLGKYGGSTDKAANESLQQKNYTY